MSLDVHNLSVRRGRRMLLENINLSVARGELLCLLGPNGAGKSTLIRCLDAILTPSSGIVTVDGIALESMKRQELARTIAYVPQQGGDTLGLTVTEMVMLGRAAHRHLENAAQRQAIIHNILRQQGLESFASRIFDTLSGGERQRVLIARAVAQDAAYMLLDEPTSALDLRHQLTAVSHIRNLVDQQGIGAVMAIHDLSIAARFAHRVALIQDGRLVAQGEWRKVLTPPQIRTVFGVDARISEVDGIPSVIAVEPA